MSVCANRTDNPGFFTACTAAAAGHRCVCGDQVRDWVNQQLGAKAEAASEDELCEGSS